LEQGPLTRSNFELRWSDKALPTMALPICCGSPSRAPEPEQPTPVFRIIRLVCYDEGMVSAGFELKPGTGGHLTLVLLLGNLSVNSAARIWQGLEWDGRKKSIMGEGTPQELRDYAQTPRVK
jgi:hypothetical protein